jgi:hypothetical protein
MAAGISLMSSGGSIATSYYSRQPVDTTQKNGGLGAAGRDSYGQSR